MSSIVCDEPVIFVTMKGFIMKQKQKLSFILAILLLCLSVCSCESVSQNHDDATNQSIDLSGGFIQDSWYGLCGPYIFYFDGEMKLARYNVLTKTSTTGNMYPDTPLLEKSAEWSFSMSVDHTLYASATPLFQGPLTDETYTYLFALDVETGNMDIIDTINDREVVNRHFVWVVEDTCYYVRKVLRDGGDQNNPDDYEQFIVSKKAGDKSFKKVVSLPKDQGLRYAVKEGLLVLSDKTVDLYDLVTGAKKTVIEWSDQDETNGINSSNNIMSCAYKDGIFFFLVLVPAEPGQVMGQYLYSLDLSTGQLKKVIEKKLSSVYFTKEGIYYNPVDYRVMWVDPDDETHTIASRQSPEVYLCDLDGGNERVVYTNESLRYPNTTSLVVWDGKMYGSFSQWSNERHSYDSLGFCELDFHSGELIQFSAVDGE